MAEADSNGMMRRMTKLETDFNKIPAEQLVLKRKTVDETPAKDSSVDAAREQASNQRLLTPRMRKMMQKKDAAVMLKEEVGESLKRLKAAKFGHRISEIAPQYQNSFYLPDQDQYKVVTPKIQDLRYALRSQDNSIDRARGGRN